MSPFQKSLLGGNVLRMRVPTLLLTPAYISWDSFNLLRWEGKWFGASNPCWPFKCSSLQRLTFSVFQPRGLKTHSSQQSAGLWPVKALTCLRKMQRRSDTKAHAGQQSGALQRHASSASDTIFRNFSLLTVHMIAISRSVHIPRVWIKSLKWNPFSLVLIALLMLLLQKKKLSRFIFNNSLEREVKGFSWAVPWEMTWGMIYLSQMVPGMYRLLCEVLWTERLSPFQNNCNRNWGPICQKRFGCHSTERQFNSRVNHHNLFFFFPSLPSSTSF